MNLDGKTAVITGTSSGNGRAIATRLASEGAAIVCVDLAADPRDTDFDGETPTHELINETGGKAHFVTADVTDGDAVRNAMAEAVDTFGSIDICVPNAGISPQPPVHLPEEEFETYRKVMSINVDGAWWTAREAARWMRDEGDGGRIVLISSIAGLMGTDSGAHYCISKGAVNQLVRSLAFQMAPHNINVNAVCPGFVRTAMTQHYLSVPEQKQQVLDAHPLGRIGETADVAGAVAFFCGPDSSWLTGVLLPVDGGYTAV